MRTIVTSLLLLAATPWLALAQPAPPSATNLVKLHPGPWRMPTPIMAGMRFEPETGDVVEGTPSTTAVALARTQAEARAIAAQNVVRHADGSRHAIVGAAFRQYVFVTTDAEGRLEQDCVSSEAEMRARVEAAAPKQERK
jgi:class 3 adenylate cyclase